MPLGLVERKHQPRRGTDESFTPERGTELYHHLPEEVITRKYQHDEFLEEVIGSSNKSKNIAIIGEPGAGKTTLLEKIGRYLIEHDALPIYIPLSNLSGTKLKQYLLNGWLDEAVAPEQLQELLQMQRVWLLLDGVDEIDASVTEALNLVSHFINEQLGVRFVITCRLNVWDASTKNLLDFQNYKTQEFSNQQVQNFITQWFERASSSDSGDKLWKKLNESGRKHLLDLVKNPLRLALMCQAWCSSSDTDLPSTQAALYEGFTCNYYEWKRTHFSITDEQQDKLNNALGKLAQKAIDSPTIRFRIRKKLALSVMGENLFNLALKLGWLNQVDRDKGIRSISRGSVYGQEHGADERKVGKHAY